ncbi:MAG: iron-sulfur cluster carrier protein ApbC [Fluviibacter sp.]
MTTPEQNACLAEAGALLCQLIDPVTGKSYLTPNQVAGALTADAAGLIVNLTVGYPVALEAAAIQLRIQAALHPLVGADVRVHVQSVIEAHVVQRNLPLLKGVKNLIAVASGKGGVGKSSTAVNLALALSRHGAKVGLLDADIYGPSIPQMLGIGGEKPHSPDGKHIEALQAHGIALMSIGFLVDAESPMVWRGPMVTSALEQLLRDTLWGELDYLVVDMPPGTGDIQLTLAQKVPVTGSVIVTTPQDIALLDARKGIRMFEKVGVPIFGIVENMSMHICTNCGHTEAIFGEGGGAALGTDYQVPLLGQLPLDMRIRVGLDAGQPIVAADPDCAISQTYLGIALKVAGAVAASGRDMSHKFPKIVIE